MSRRLAGMDHADLVLYRIEPARNMARFYALSVDATLFGGLALTRRWGRIGSRGRQIVELHPGAPQALDALERIALAKRRRGYR